MSLWITRSLRRRLALDRDAPAFKGKVTLPSFTAAYALAERLREAAAAEGRSEEGLAVDAPAIVALDVLEEMVERRLEGILSERGDELLERGAKRLAERWGEERTREILGRLLDELELVPPGAAAEARGDSADEAGCVRELLVLAVLARHDGARGVLSKLGLPVDEDAELGEALATLTDVLRQERPLAAGERDLLAELAAPFETGDEGFAETLRRVIERWGDAEGEVRRRLDAALGLLAEAATQRLGPGHAPDPGIGLDEGPAAYTPDAKWMPDLVLAAKNALVWLDQLSGRYGRVIRRLDEIPPEELDALSRRGVSGLWLIGVWERSPASGRIKRAQGQEDAAPSAYSVRRYRIAAELGGEPALDGLSAAARRRGIRLAVDFVPNHLAIDSDWVIEHPERFLSVTEPPFPGYSFTGEDLSPDPEVGIFLEDHYVDKSDAAVVFERLDRRTGERRYIYHGNDGTSTPWNDTAQLDYMNPATREAVTETVLEVAGRFSILRFDAAMTLTRQHLHRLWYPAPGAAGAIPSRAEHSLSTAEIERRMPREFWRELVDRVQAESPDTLLAAEAFWLMEGYFVRRLGMHRVYNSAFMHMLREGRTDALRRMLAETVALDPALLGRFVNYLSNPDEETAVEQFGRGDRYFGACKVLATLPGLPMLAHGQWEGLAEKYGMEYRRARRDEAPDEDVVARHDREIAPLLRDRRRFSRVEDFLLLEMRVGKRTIDSVLAYANGRLDELMVVAFNNSAKAVSGRLTAVVGGELAARLGKAAAAVEEGDDGAARIDWELADWASDRSVAWKPPATGSGAAGHLELALAPYECVVLGAPRPRGRPGRAEGEPEERASRPSGPAASTTRE